MMHHFWAGSVLAAALSAPADEPYQGHLESLIDRIWPEGGAPVAVDAPGSQATFQQVVESDGFLHEAVGPFDVYLYLADGLGKEREAKKALKAIVKGLQPTVPVMERHFGSGDEGHLIGGRRLPMLFARSDRGRGERGFEELVALLAWAEDDWTSWKPDGNPIWGPELLAGLNVRTWEAQVFNLGHEFAEDQGKAFLAHGIGYYQLAHVAARVLRQGSWGLVPPWLAQGVIDELDIEAYGEAWVGSNKMVIERPGWFRPGWSGFVPQGMRPPPPVVGPPKDLAVTVRRGGDSWQHRDFSTERHWEHLHKDLKSEAPASFAFMAEHESFLPRDRALARALMHLVLHSAAPEDREGLLQALDRAPTKRSNGMYDSDPLPMVFSRVLGGVAGVEALEAMPLGELLPAIGRGRIADELRSQGAEGLLALSDHREQCQWLYRKSMPMDRRQTIWNLILEAEYWQQLEQWKALGAALDEASRAALAVNRRYPKRDRDLQAVRTAFWQALGEEGAGESD